MLLSIEIGRKARLIQKILEVCFPDVDTILDMTYGNGRFWYQNPDNVTGVDIDSTKSPDVVADFTRLPFANSTFDLCIFDPPYQSDTSRHTPSVMDSRFGSFRTVAELEHHIRVGAREAWRVCKIGVIVNVQDYIHSQQRLRLTKWVEEEIGQDPYDIVFLMKQNMISDPTWTDQLSVRSNHTTFLIFRKGSQYHRRRKRNEIPFS